MSLSYIIPTSNTSLICLDTKFSLYVKIKLPSTPCKNTTNTNTISNVTF